MRHSLRGPVFFLISVLCCGGQAPGGVQFDNLVQTYDGTASYPDLSVDGLACTPRFACRLIDPSSTQTVFSNIPAAIAWSYASLSFSAQQTSELGNFVQLAGSRRVADHVETVMVTWASASRYPSWSSSDPTGYTHPVTARIYQPVPATGGGTAFQLVDESTVHVHIPWKPTILPTGAAYPYNGYAFRVIIPLSARIALPESCVVAIAYSTQSSGSTPIGSPGPYNELNVALSSGKPVTGTDPDPSSVFWIKNGQWFYPATGWGGVGSPMITLNARQNALPLPVLSSAVSPLHAGIYHVSASINSPTVEAAAVLRVSKATAMIQAGGLVRSVADPPLGPVLTTDPPGLPCEVTFSGNSALPAIPGVHPFEARVSTQDHEGTLKGNFTLTAERYEQWTGRVFTGLPSSLSAGPADPDGDGLSNWHEYATGGDPMKANPAIMPERVTGGMRITYPVRRGMDRIRVNPEFSKDLSSWTETATTTGNSSDLWETRHATVSGTNGFFRFKAWDAASP